MKALFRGGWSIGVGIASIGCGSVSEPDPVEQVATVEEAIRSVPQDLCEFTIYSDQRSDIRDRSRSTGGFIGSRTAVELGSAGLVTGHLRSGGTVLLRSRSQVEGNVTAAGAITQQSQVVVTGTLSPNTPNAQFTIPTKTVTAGTTDVNVFNGQTRVLAPGNYRDVHAFGGSTLRLRTGVYNMRSFIVESSTVSITLDITSGPIDVNVQGQVRFGDRMSMQLLGGTNPRQVRYYTNWPNQVTIGTDLTLFGVLTAPNAEITAFSRTNVRGSLFGRRVTLDTDGTISGACECGNGFVDNVTEQCDDGNTNNNDACTNECTVAFCGDGIVRAGVEECDDGNADDLDSCTTPGAFGEPGCEFRPLRRNVAHISQAERTALINAIVAVDQNPAFRYHSGVSYWDIQDAVHEATHVHGGPAFITWHRELVNRFERLLRLADPTVALHYWDWTTDPLSSPDGQGGFVDLFTAQTFGSPTGRADVPFDLLDNGGVFAGSREDTGNDADPVQNILRGVSCPAGTLDSDISRITSSDGFPQDQEWSVFRQAVEATHNNAHSVCMGGTIGNPHTAFEDPFVFILHSNVDRLWAMWQRVVGKSYRLDPAQVYGIETTDPEITEFMEPWAGGSALIPWDPAQPPTEIVAKSSTHPSVVRPPRYDTVTLP